MLLSSSDYLPTFTNHQRPKAGDVISDLDALALERRKGLVEGTTAMRWWGGDGMELGWGYILMASLARRPATTTSRSTDRIL